jgi:hypothetical protein
MPLIELSNFGMSGVVSDAAPWDLDPSALTDGRNFRIHNGRIMPSGGSQLATTEVASGGKIGHIVQSISANGDNIWIVCTETTIEKWNGSDFEVIFTYPYSVDETLFSACVIGSVVFVNNPDSYPVYWTNDGSMSDAEWLTWGPAYDENYDLTGDIDTWQDAGKKCRVLASHKNFLFALGMIEQDGGAVVYGDRVRWSHPCEPNGIPYTWEEPNSADRSSIAGYVTLGRGGDVVGGESMRDSMVIYSQKAISIMDFTGDALGWRRRSISNTFGLCGKDAVVECKGMHYFMSTEDILAFDGNQVQSLLQGRMRKRYAADLNYSWLERCFCLHNMTFNEIWFCFPTNNSSQANMAYTYNYRDQSIGIRDLTLFGGVIHADFGRGTLNLGKDQWDDSTLTWEQIREIWDQNAPNPFGGLVLGGVGDQIYSLDTSTPEDITESYIERVGMPTNGHDNNTTVTRLYPHVEGSSSITVKIGSQQKAGSYVDWKSSRDFTPSLQRKVDVKSTGELHCLRIDMPADGNVTFTGLDIEATPAGKR